MQVKLTACLASMIPKFKKEKYLGGHIINKKSNSCVLNEDLIIINFQQNQQQ